MQQRNTMASNAQQPLYPLPDQSLVVQPTTVLVNTLTLPPHNPNATLLQQCKQFTLQNKIFVLLLPLLYISMLNNAATCSAFVLVFALPVALVLWLYQRSFNYQYIELEILTRLYSIGFTTGSLVVLVLESVLTVLFAIVCFNNQLQRYLAEWSDAISGQPDTAENKHTFDPTNDSSIPHDAFYYVFLWLLCYVSAGCVEEGLKYWAINRVKQYRPTIKSESAYIYYAVAIALGFSTIENIGYLFNTCVEADAVWEIALSAVERVCISTPLHVMTSVLIGIGVIRRDLQNEPLKLRQIMLLPVIYHGSFDFGLMCISSVNEQIGDISSLMLTLVYVAVVELSLALTIRHQWKRYQINDPNKAGFGLLESDSSSDIEAQRHPLYTPQYMQPAAYELYYNSLTPEQKQALHAAQTELQSYQQNGTVAVPIRGA